MNKAILPQKVLKKFLNDESELCTQTQQSAQNSSNYSEA